MNESVCQYTVNTAFDPASDRPPFFEVEDLASDPRFASIPLVTGQPYLRYYGGIPLYTQSGIAIGALVIIDNKPRRLMQLDEQKCEQIDETSC